MANNNSSRKSMNGLDNNSVNSNNINITENLDMNNYRIVDLANGVDSNDAVNVGQIAGIATNTTRIISIENSCNIYEASINAFDLTSVETSLNFLDLSGIQFALAIDNIEASCNIYEISINSFDLTSVEASLNFLELSGIQFSTAIALNTAKVGITPSQASAIVANTAKVGITPSQANKITDNETAIDSLVGLTTTHTAEITALETSSNVYELAIGEIETSCNVYEISINALEAAGGGSPWTTSGASIYRQNGLVGIGGDIINPSPALQLDVSGIFRVAQMETDADDNTQNNKAGFVADGRTGQFYSYNISNVPTSASSGPGYGFAPDAMTLRQYNRFGEQPKLYTELFIQQLHRTIAKAGSGFDATDEERSAVWGIGVRNETTTGSYVGFQYESTILALAYGGGSVVINPSLESFQNNNYRLRVHGLMGATGYRVVSDDRIKYHESDITGALATLNKLKAQKYQKITESINQTGKWIPSDAEWDSVKNSYDSSGRRLFQYEEEIGFIAQDVRKINDISFCVSGEEVDKTGDETPLLVSYQDLFVLSIQGIQELDAKRREDNKKFIDLNKRLKILEDKLKNIESSSEKEYIL